MGIFYVNQTLGRHGKPIKIYKFRTMIPGADELYPDLVKMHGLDSHGKINDDPRVTKLGKFLRKYWIDEIPQIFTNFTLANIKLVGIRPRNEDKWDEFPSDHKERTLKYNPGLFNIDYLREGKSFSEIIEFEKKYLDKYEKHPFLTDTKYFFKLVYKIVFNGARSH